MPTFHSEYRTPSRGEIDQLVERGRHLQSEALRSGFKRAFSILVASSSLRGLRLAGQRQPCT